MKKIFALVMALALVLTATCGFVFAEESEGPRIGISIYQFTDSMEQVRTAQDAPRIGISIYQFTDNFMTLYRNELQRYLTEELGVPAENITIVDGKNDQAEQTNQINTFIADNVDVMILNLVQTSSSASVIQQADAAGIPVVFINREPSEEDMALSDNICYVGRTPASPAPSRARSCAIPPTRATSTATA